VRKIDQQKLTSNKDRYLSKKIITNPMTGIMNNLAILILARALYEVVFPSVLGPARFPPEGDED